MALRNGVFYTDQGEGDISLVFLHFFGGSSNSWNEVIPLLSSKFRCLALDLYGFGQTKTPDIDINVDLQTKLVLQAINELQLKDFVLIGHSMGGKISLSAASHQPVGLRGVLLAAPSPPTPEPIPDDKRASLKQGWGSRPEMEKLVKGLTVDPLEKTVFERVVKDHLAVSAKAWNAWLDIGSREDISAQMKKVTVPVLVTNGSDDPNFTMDFLRQEIGGNIAQTAFQEVAGAGHLIPLEKPEKLAALITGFAALEGN
nr:Alpha/beta hydrolase family [uncultured organism]